MSQSAEKRIQFNILDTYIRELCTLKRIVGSMGVSASDAEDILQDVFMQLLQKFRNDWNEDRIVRWLIKVTVNRCMLEHRRRQSSQRQSYEISKAGSQISSGLSGPENKLIQTEQIEVMRQSLEALPESLLAPLVLRYFCGLNSNEIGEILELNPSTVRSRLREGRLTLAKRLIERGIEE